MFCFIGFYFVFRRGFSLQEALEMAYADETINVDSIYIEPPGTNGNVLTDEESGDDEDVGDLDHLSGGQLRAQAELKLSDNRRIGGSQMMAKEQPTAVISNKKQKIKKKIEEKHFWEKGDLQSRQNEFRAPNFQKYADFTPTELFEMFWSNDIFTYIRDETKKYALFKNYPDPNVTIEEIKCVVGILILSGYDAKPGRRFYWDSKPDMANPMVKNAMRRNRFDQVLQFLHLADNSFPDLKDKAWKIRPLMDKLNETFLEHFTPEEEINFDESMVKYFGRHSCKQFIRGKPIRFGFKMWSLNTRGGYLINFDIYQGNNPRANEDNETLYGKSTAPLIMMVEELLKIKKSFPYKLYTDNLFTSVNLLKGMRDVGIWCTGTLRENRLPRGIPLPTKKELQKNSNRGDHYYSLDKESGIIFVRWMDNNVVTMASTCYGLEPISNVKRFSQKEKKIIQVSRPNLIGRYNNSMGGTDLMDQNVSRYRIAIRCKKWWWCLFSWMLDVSIENAWYIYNKAEHNIPQLSFRREIATTYLTKYGTEAKGAGRPLSGISQNLSRVSSNIRYDRIDHFLMNIPNKKRWRCANEGCSSIVRTMCRKCNIGLCIDCNIKFHQK